MRRHMSSRAFSVRTRPATSSSARSVADAAVEPPPCRNACSSRPTNSIFCTAERGTRTVCRRTGSNERAATRTQSGCASDDAMTTIWCRAAWLRATVMKRRRLTASPEGIGVVPSHLPEKKDTETVALLGPLGAPEEDDSLDDPKRCPIPEESDSERPAPLPSSAPSASLASGLNRKSPSDASADADTDAEEPAPSPPLSGSTTPLPLRFTVTVTALDTKQQGKWHNHTPFSCGDGVK
mmetsp:Transcript_23562/g.66112  ORF Transcript_23562/g.66112 Transcript_23562/m.66112 type:complete len:238 (-) Transcript_23562:520-1233(-)